MSVRARGAVHVAGRARDGGARARTNLDLPNVRVAPILVIRKDGHLDEVGTQRALLTGLLLGRAYGWRQDGDSMVTAWRQDGAPNSRNRC